MAKYAFLKNNTVAAVQELEDADFILALSNYELGVDVTDLIVCPEIGWVLQGNILVPGVGQQVTLKKAVMSKILRNQSIAPTLLVDLYATNTLLGMTAAQSDAMFSECSDAIIRLQQGAFPTAIYCLQHKALSSNVTQSMIDNWISLIQAAQ
jgi:hypothetical protein